MSMEMPLFSSNGTLEPGQILQGLQVPLLVVDAATNRLNFLNHAAEQLWGYEPGEAHGMDVSGLLPELAELLKHVLLPSAAGLRAVQGYPYLGQSKAGEELKLSLWLVPLGTDGSTQLLVMARPAGVTPDGALPIALSDPLTGLASRTLFQDRLSQALRAARRHQGAVAVLSINIDQFNLVNSTLGHDLGDQLLIRVAERLVDEVRSYDTVARFGCDEFCVVLPHVADEQGVMVAAERIQRALDVPFVLDGQELYMTFTIGLSRFPQDGEDPLELLAAAHAARRHAARARASGYQVFDAAMRTRGERALEVKTLLHKALERNELFLQYQPQVDTLSGHIVGVEALVRWKSETLGVVPPLDFIPLAEETGMIGPITEWVLETACAQARAWQDAGLPPIRMAVNLSGSSFGQKQLVPLVGRVLAATRFEPSLLDLEITENVLMENVAATSATLAELASWGLKFSLDDFGTGYSSLGYLRRLPISILKIDRTFVRELQAGTSDAAIIQAVVALARGLGIEVIAEGVETLEQAELLAELGCSQVQGFYYSKPVFPEEIARMLAQGAIAGPIELGAGAPSSSR